MKNMSKGMIAGLMIEMIAGVIMVIMVMANMAIPDVIARVFGVGLAMTLISCVLTSGKRNQDLSRRL